MIEGTSRSQIHVRHDYSTLGGGTSDRSACRPARSSAPRVKASSLCSWGMSAAISAHHRGPWEAWGYRLAACGCRLVVRGCRLAVSGCRLAVRGCGCTGLQTGHLDEPRHLRRRPGHRLGFRRLLLLPWQSPLPEGDIRVRVLCLWLLFSVGRCGLRRLRWRRRYTVRERLPASLLPLVRHDNVPVRDGG